MNTSQSDIVTLYPSALIQISKARVTYPGDSAFWCWMAPRRTARGMSPWRTDAAPHWRGRGECRNSFRHTTGSSSVLPGTAGGRGVRHGGGFTTSAVWDGSSEARVQLGWIPTGKSKPLCSTQLRAAARLSRGRRGTQTAPGVMRCSGEQRRTGVVIGSFAEAPLWLDRDYKPWCSFFKKCPYSFIYNPLIWIVIVNRGPNICIVAPKFYK